MTTGSGEWLHAMRRFVAKAVAAVALAMLVTMSVAGLDELRAALAFERFDMARRTAEKVQSKERFAAVLERASEEAEVVMKCGSHDAQVFWEISRACHRWSKAEKTTNPVLRLEFAERAARAAALAACAAPSDYTNWLQVARTQASLGLSGAAEKCRARARALAPSHRESHITKLQVKR